MGDFMYIKDKTLAKGRWPLTGVTGIYKGVDQRVVVDIIANGNTYKRSIQSLVKIYLEDQPSAPPAETPNWSNSTVHLSSGSKYFSDCLRQLFTATRDDCIALYCASPIEQSWTHYVLIVLWVCLHMLINVSGFTTCHTVLTLFLFKYVSLFV